MGYPVPQGSVGSNPTPRTSHLLARADSNNLYFLVEQILLALNVFFQKMHMQWFLAAGPTKS